MRKHTPEPWEVKTQQVGSYRYTSVYQTSEPKVRDDGLICALYETNEIAEANALRIVACVNACTGLDIKTLDMMLMAGETIRKRFDAARHEIRDMTAQRDELLAALKDLHSAELEYDREGDGRAFIELEASKDAAAKTIAKFEVQS